MPDVMAEIAAERRRQVEVRGYSHDQDDRHCSSGQLVGYLWEKRLLDARRLPVLSASRRKLLVQAAALIVAELERIDRLQVRARERDPFGLPPLPPAAEG